MRNVATENANRLWKSDRFYVARRPLADKFAIGLTVWSPPPRLRLPSAAYTAQYFASGVGRLLAKVSQLSACSRNLSEFGVFLIPQFSLQDPGGTVFWLGIPYLLLFFLPTAGAALAVTVIWRLRTKEVA